MALFIASKAHLTFRNFIIPRIHNPYDTSSVAIAWYLAAFIAQHKIHLTIQADKFVHLSFFKCIILQKKTSTTCICVVLCTVWCLLLWWKKGDWQSQYPDAVWNTSSPTVVHLHGSIQPSWLLPFRPALKWIVHPPCLDELFFNQWGELNAIADRLMHINLILVWHNFFFLFF